MTRSWSFRALKSRWFNLFFWLFVAGIIIIPRALDLNVFFARDELSIWRWSDEFSAAVFDGDASATHSPDNFYPAIPVFWAQTAFLTFKYNFPALFEQTIVPLKDLSVERSLDLLGERRLVTALFVALQMILAVWMVDRLFGRWTALFSAIFMGLDPFMLAESRVFRLQMASTMFVVLSALAYLLYFKRRRRRWILVSGVMAGLGVSTQTSTGLIVPFIWLLLALDFFLASNQAWFVKFKALIGNALLWAFCAIASFWLIWPALWVEPVKALTDTYLLGFQQAAQSSVWHGEGFFLGKIIEEDPGPLFYPIAFAFRTTPLTWLGLGSALVVIVAVIRRRRQRKPHPFDDEATLWYLPQSITNILLIFLAAIVIWVSLTAILSKVDRYLLEAYPFINIISAFGIAHGSMWLVNTLKQRAQFPAGTVLAGIAMIVFVIYVAALAPVHPHYYTYWNPLFGGGKAAMNILPMGNGEGIDQVAAYAQSQPGSEEATLVCGGSQPWCDYAFEGETYRYVSYIDGQWANADYASFYISHLQKNTYPQEIVEFFMQQTPLYQFEVQGASYAWLYKIPEIDYFAGPKNDLTGLGRLLGYNLSAPDRTVTAGESVEAEIWWINYGAGVDNLLLRIVDETGYEWARGRVAPLVEYETIPAGKKAVLAGAASLILPVTMPPGQYTLRIGAIDPESAKLLGEFAASQEGDAITVLAGERPANPGDLQITHPLEALPVPSLKLLGYESADPVIAPNVPAWIALYWRALDTPPHYAMALRLIDAQGNEVARWQDDERPTHYPSENWQKGNIVKDVWPLKIGSEIPVGQYQLMLSLNGDDAENTPIEDVDLGAVQVWANPLSYDIPKMQAELNTDFNEQITLLGYDLFYNIDQAESGVLLPHLYWRAQADMTTAYEVLITLRDSQSNEAAAYWRVPLGINGAKENWKQNEVLTTVYGFDVGNIMQESYHLDIALQQIGNDRPEAVLLPNGASSPFITIENIQNIMVTRILRNEN